MAGKAQSIRSKLKLDKHHKIEQFGIGFCAFALAFAFIFGHSFKVHIDNKNITLTSQAKYTQEGQFSLSGDTMNVVEVYRNNDYTKAFVLLEVANHDMSHLSTQATDYQMLMTGYNGELTGGTPTGTIYMFGSEGYIGLYLANPTGFDSQLYDVVLRNINSPWLASSKPDPDTLNADDYPGVSYMYNNQFHFYANFAGTDGVVADFLNEDSFTLDEMYACVMSNADQSAIRDQLGQSLANLNQDMIAINAWAVELQNAGISVPALPACIAGDSMTTDATQANNPMYYTSAMDAPVTSYAELGSVTLTEEQTNSDLYLVTDYVFKGGVQFNYQSVGLYDSVSSIISGIPGQPTEFDLSGSYDDWETYRQIATTSMPSVEGMFTYYANGHVLTEADAYANADDVEHGAARTPYQNAIAGFEAAVAQYIADKYDYQVNVLPSYIAEKQSTENRTQGFTIRSGEDTLIIY